MISVIIDVHDNQKYLIRCLNSIKRQTYKDIEIIIMSKENIDSLPKDIVAKVNIINDMDRCEAISNTFEMAEGAGVLVVTCDCMLTDNVIRELLETSQDLSVCSYVDVCIPAGVDYRLDKKAYANIYGKLYNREILKKVIVGAKAQSELEILATYLGQCEQIVLAEEATIYESRKENLFEMVSGCDVEYWKKILQVISDKCTSREIRNYITSGIGEIISETSADTEDIMLYVCEKHYEDAWLNYMVARRIVKYWWEKLLNVKNHKEYRCFVEYLSKFQGGVVAELLLNECGIDGRMFEVMKDNEQAVFIDILSKASKNGSVNVTILNTKQETTGGEVYSYEMTGTHLADFVIDKYKTGCLGLKTILKSLMAWLKYKL